MAKRHVSIALDVIEGLDIAQLDNCTQVDKYICVLNASHRAKVVFKDDLGEYIATWFPNFGWAWGE